MVDEKQPDLEAEAQEEAQESAVPEETLPMVEETVEQRITELEADLEKASAQRDDYLDQLLRARADYANYKRRVEQEKKELVRYSNAALMSRLLPVLDDFERAFQTVPHELLQLTWIDGVSLIQRKLQLVLEAEGLAAIDLEGKKFDPVLHEAISYEDRTDMEDGTIIAEVQKGYKMGDRVLRPTLVRVARKIAKPGEPSAEINETEQTSE
jgi:molecular chaperone GrpE